MAETRYEYQITADVAQFRRAMDESSRSAATASREITESFRRSGSDLSSRLSGLRNILAGAFSVGAVVQFGRAITASTLEAERSTALLNATLRSTGYAAGLTRTDIEGLVSDLSKLSGFDDDPIREGVVSLLRFREVSGATFREAAQAAVDLAVATGSDVPSAFQKIGRALQDPEKGIKALREVGVRLSEGQQELAKKLRDTGDAAGSQRIVLDELKRSVGGAGATGGEGLTGATRSLANAWDDLLKNIGQTQAVAGGAKATLDSLATAANLANRLLSAPDSGLRGSIGAAGVPRARTRIGELSESEALALQGIGGGRVNIAEPKATDKEAVKKAQREAEAIARQMRVGTEKQAQAGIDVWLGQVQQLVKAYEEVSKEKEAALQVGPVEAERQATELRSTIDALLKETPSGQRATLNRQLDELNERLIAGKISAREYEEVFPGISKKLSEVRDVGEDVFDSLSFAADDWVKQLENAINGFEREFTSTLADIVIEGEADFARLGKSFARMVLQMQIQQAITTPLANSLSGALSSLFAKSPTASPFTTEMGSGLKAYYGGARAEGGPVSAGRLYLVGERGPELFMPRQAGTVVPNGGSGGVTINNYIDSRTDLASIAAINQRTVRQIEDINAMRGRR